MSLYHLIEGVDTLDLDDLAELFAELVSARKAAENAEQDQRHEVSAEVRANHYGAQADELTADLESKLQAVFPALRAPITAVRSAA